MFYFYFFLNHKILNLWSSFISLSSKWSTRILLVFSSKFGEIIPLITDILPAIINGTIIGTLVGVLLGIIGTYYGDLSVLTGGIIDLPVYGSIIGGLVLGFLMAFGALLGDLVGSFIKRRIGLQSGEPAPIMDQLDFVVGALILSLLVVKISWEFFIIVAVLTLILHLGSNMIAYLLGIKDVWY